MNNATNTVQRITPASIINGTVSNLLRTYKEEADNNPDIYTNDQMVIMVTVDNGGIGATFIPPDPDFCVANGNPSNLDFTAGWFGTTATLLQDCGLTPVLANRLIAESGTQGKERCLIRFVFPFSDFYNFAINTADELVHTSNKPSTGFWGTGSRQVSCVVLPDGPDWYWLHFSQQRPSRKDLRSGDPRKRAGKPVLLPFRPSYPFASLTHKVMA